MINVFQPALQAEELAAVERVFKSNWIGKGSEVLDFEKEFAAYIGRPPEHFTSTTCATEGLFLAELLGDGYDIIVPSISFVAAGSAISDESRVLCDVDPLTLNVRAEDIEKVITVNTKAVIITHYAGVSCEMDDIITLCRQHGIRIIEDSACALGGKYKGVSCGTMGDMGIWSFDAMKTICTGDGGMLYFKDPVLTEIAKEQLYLGLPNKQKSGMDSAGSSDRWWEFDITCPGRRAIMNNIAGAIGREQLKKLPSYLQRRKEIDGIYRQELRGLGWLNFPDVLDHITPSYYSFFIQTFKRDKLAKYLLDKGIYTTFRYWPLHKIGLFKDGGNYPNADYAAKTTLNLPLHQSLTDSDVEKIVEAIRKFQ